MKNILLTRDGISLELDDKQASKLLNFGNQRYLDRHEMKKEPDMSIHSFYDEDEKWIYSITCIAWSE